MIMVDIETMAVHESKSLILSAAAVQFELAPEAPTFGPEKVWRLDLRGQLVWGRRVDPETQRWWSSQATSAIRQWAMGPIVQSFDFLRELAAMVGDQEVWANGICFDLCNIVQLAEDVQVERPWKYNKARDARTIYSVLPVARHMGPDAFGTPHDPLDDCKFQVWKLWERWVFTSIEN